jgi:hypothetical protein
MGVRLGSVRERRALLKEVIAACIGSSVVAAVVMRPVLAAPSKRVYGLPSDPLSEVWRLEQFRSGQIGLIGNSVSTMANVPSGVALRRPIEATQILYDVPAWLLVHVLTPVPAYNVLVFLGLWITGLATYASARALRIGMIGSALAACLFVLAPIHLVEAQLHVPLSYVAPLPVLLALGILTIAEPSPRRGVLLGVIAGVCGYLNAYLLLVAAVLLGALSVVAVWTAVADRDRRRPLLVAGGAAAVAAALTLAPLAIVLLAFHGSIAGSVTRSEADVVTFSLRPGSYFERSAGTYIGIAGLLVAVAGLVFGRVSRSARVTIAVVGLAGLALSLRPGTSVLGTHPTMPAQLVHDVIPYYRVFGRLEILAALAVGMLAGLAVDRLAGWRPIWAPAAAVLIAAVAIADVVRDPPPPAGDLGSRDPVATWLASGSGPVAEYPLYGFDNYLLGGYLFRQIRDGRPLLNGSIEGTLSGELAAAASTPTEAKARAALLRAGVRAIVVHPPTELPPSGTGFTLVRRFPDGSVGYVLEPAR